VKHEIAAVTSINNVCHSPVPEGGNAAKASVTSVGGGGVDANFYPSILFLVRMSQKQ
jgi:hypothetical protein